MHAADEIASAARHLLAAAVAAGEAGVPRVPEAGPLRPDLPATAVQPGSLLSPLPLGEAGRRPGEGADEAAPIPCTLPPALSQRERERSPLRSASVQAALPPPDAAVFPRGVAALPCRWRDAADRGQAGRLLELSGT